MNKFRPESKPWKKIPIVIVGLVARPMLFSTYYTCFLVYALYIYNYIYMSTQHPTLQTFLAVQAQAKKNKCSLSDVLKHS